MKNKIVTIILSALTATAIASCGLSPTPAPTPAPTASPAAASEAPLPQAPVVSVIAVQNSEALSLPCESKEVDFSCSSESDLVGAAIKYCVGVRAMQGVPGLRLDSYQLGTSCGSSSYSSATVICCAEQAAPPPPTSCGWMKEVGGSGVCEGKDGLRMQAEATCLAEGATPNRLALYGSCGPDQYGWGTYYCCK